MTARKATYAKKDDASSSREERMTRLKMELREHIRFLSDYEILSTDWLRMAESLHQIANVAFMETHLPPSDDNPLLQKGKKDSGTLWDQERDELAIRILLEEGKLNLALRVLHKYKVAFRSDKFDEMVKSCCKKFASDQVVVTDRCKVFEQSLGMLLKLSLQHVEACQIMDLPELMEHVKEVLTEAVKSDRKGASSVDADKMQETLVIHYLGSIGGKMEDMDEDRLMDLIESNNIITLLVDHLNKHYTWYKPDTLEAASRFLSAVMASEAYTTDPSTYIKGDALITQVVALKGLFVSELVTSYGLKKSDVQKFLDEVEKFEKKVGPTKVVPLPFKPTKKPDTDVKDHKEAKASTAEPAATV